MDTGRTIGKDGEAVLIIVFITTGLEVYLDFAFFECSGCVSGDGCIEIQALASSIRSIVGHSKVRQVRENGVVSDFQCVVGGQVTATASHRLHPIYVDFVLFSSNSFFYSTFSALFLFVTVWAVVGIATVRQISPNRISLLVFMIL